MKDLKTILEDQRIFQWESDPDVLDLEIENVDKPLLLALMEEPCPNCESPLIMRGDKLLKMAKNNLIEGTHLICKSCKQKWYIHFPVKIPKLEELSQEGNM